MKKTIVENTWLRPPVALGINFEIGWGNGYVLIPFDHPFHGMHYDDINRYIEVHGGLTYSQLVTEKGLEHFNLSKEDIGGWLVGFDTAHCDDSLINWPKERVQEETDYLEQQLEALYNERLDEPDSIDDSLEAFL